MKKKEHIIKKFLLLGLICWVIYCGSEFLLYLVLYRETMSHERDYSILFWTQHIVLAIAYHLLFFKPVRLKDAANGFHPLYMMGDFFRRNWKQLLLWTGCGILYEVIQIAFPHSDNLVSALLILYFPSTALFHTPIIRTIIGFSISVISIVAGHMLLHYRIYSQQKRNKTINDD